jgi:glycosyltransferase involved in cell wall biosynthesis
LSEFSIIIPFKSWSGYLEECLEHIRRLVFTGYEVILLPDEVMALPSAYRDMPISVIPTGVINPAVKRDLGVKVAKGEYLAFIDDDAYPQADWLDVAYDFFTSRGDVGAIGGPGVTPKADPFWSRVSGAVFLSRISGGFPERYVSCPPGRPVEDWPTVNLFVRKETYDAAGGFDSNYWPGEDTLFCLKIIQNTGKTIFYLPELKVWHHRRSQLSKHLRQVGNYGLHRGHFSKKFPQTSRKIKYFIPTLWVIFILMGLFLSLLPYWVIIAYVFGWVSYLIGLVISFQEIRKHETFRVALSATPYILLTHLWYGIKFIQGLMIKELKGSLGR